MKFKRLLIIGVAVLSLGSISGLTTAVNADSTPAERNASIAADNALTEKYGNNVPTSASLKTEIALNKEFEGSSSNTNAGKSQSNQPSNTQQTHNPQQSNRSTNSTSDNQVKNLRHKNKKDNNSSKKSNNKENKSKNKKNKSITKTKSLKKHNHKTNHHFIGIGITIIAVIVILGLCFKFFSHKNKH